MKPFKIVHVTTVDTSLRYLLLNQLLSIKQEGYEVEGISSTGSDVKFIESMGIRHVPISLSRQISPLKDLIALWRLYRIFRREKYTIIHSHTAKPGLLGPLAARLAGVPIIIHTVHGFYFHDHMPPLKRQFFIMLEKVGARCSHLFLSQNSEDIKTAIEEHICPPEKIKFLGNGIDISRFDCEALDPAVSARHRQEFGLKDGDPVIGFVGRLVAEKGILELMDAMVIVRAKFPNVQLLIVGPVDSAKADAITPEIAVKYGLQDITVFTGKRDDMPEMYALMDVFVLPSHREGFPRSAMEASAMGIPCVTTDVRGCREAVEHDVNGLLVPLQDSTALAAAIITLLQNQEYAARLGQAGRRAAIERFDEQIIFQRVKQEYKRLIAEKHLG